MMLLYLCKTKLRAFNFDFFNFDHFCRAPSTSNYSMKYLFAHTRKIWFIYTWAITLIPSTIVNSAKQLTLFNLKLREEIQTLFNNGKKILFRRKSLRAISVVKWPATSYTNYDLSSYLLTWKFYLSSLPAWTFPFRATGSKARRVSGVLVGLRNWVCCRFWQKVFEQSCRIHARGQIKVILLLYGSSQI